MKKYFISGLAFILPLLFTIMLFVFLIDFLTSPFLNSMLSFLFEYKKNFPILENETFLIIVSRIFIMIFLIFIIFLLGLVTRLFLFNLFIKKTNKILSKIPFVKTVYKALKDVFGSFSSSERKAFRYMTMVNFFEKSFSIGYVSGYALNEMEIKIKKKLKPVYIPSSPNPISGLLIFINEEDEHKIDMTKEDCIKFILSCGLFNPKDKNVK